MANIFILGCGFGLALAKLWHEAGHAVTVYSNSPEEIKTIKQDREHKKLLPGIAIPDEINFTNDISVVAGNDELGIPPAEIVVFAVPSKFTGQAAQDLAPFIPENAVIVSVGKGFCNSDTHCRLSQIIGLYIPNNPLVVLTGPCHAEEVALGIPTTVVCAAGEPQVAYPDSQWFPNPAEYVQKILQTPTFRVYMNDDIVGCELGGALKNPIALCCGIALGMGLGDNTAAAIMTRGLAEIKRLGTALGAKWQTFTGLAGVGDLIVTCTSNHSRNHRAGRLIGEGISAPEAVAQIGTVEGYECVKIVLKLARDKNIDIPIFEQLYKVCYEGLTPENALKELMQRPQRHESEEFWQFI
jgi:glycerol-3-phosphate dehydrogenase (NAD(P)+)